MEPTKQTRKFLKILHANFPHVTLCNLLKFIHVQFIHSFLSRLMQNSVTSCAPNFAWLNVQRTQSFTRRMRQACHRSPLNECLPFLQLIQQTFFIHFAIIKKNLFFLLFSQRIFFAIETFLLFHIKFRFQQAFLHPISLAKWHMFTWALKAVQCT